MSMACANPTAWQLRGIIDHAIVIDDLFSIEHDSFHLALHPCSYTFVLPGY